MRNQRVELLRVVSRRKRIGSRHSCVSFGLYYCFEVYSQVLRYLTSLVVVVWPSIFGQQELLNIQLKAGARPHQHSGIEASAILNGSCAILNGSCDFLKQSSAQQSCQLLRRMLLATTSLHPANCYSIPTQHITVHTRTRYRPRLGVAFSKLTEGEQAPPRLKR